MSKLEGEGAGIFVDRENSTSILQQQFDRTAETESGRALFISGEPGIGKTTLVARFLASLPNQTVTVLRTRGREFAASPFVALAGLFEDASVVQPTRYGKQVALTVLNVARLVPAFGPYASAITDTVKDLRGLSEADSRIISNSLYVNNMFTSLLEKLAKKRPVVLFLDDAQWFDSSSLEVLGFAAGRLQDMRVLMIICFRRGHITSEREERNLEILDAIIRSAPAPVASSLDLGPLDNKYSGELARALLRGQCDNTGLEIMVRRGGGNPFYVTKLATELLSSPQVATTGVSNLEKVIPGTVFEAISRQLQRINRESPEARLALDYAAILGKEFSVSDLAGLTKLDELKLKHLMETVESVYGVVDASTSPGVYAFDHEMTRESIENQLGAQASPLHLKAAKYYESVPSKQPELLAQHYEKGQAYERSFLYYRKAADRSSKSYSFADSARYLAKCVSFIDDRKVKATRETRRELLLALAEAQFSRGHFGEALSNSLSVVKPAPAASLLSADALLLAGKCTRYLGISGQGKKGISYLRKAAAVYEAKGDVRKLAATYSTLATVLDHYNFHEDAVAYFGRCQKALNQSRDRTGLASLQRKSGMIYDSRMAIPYIKNALTVFERLKSKIEVGRCLNNLGAEMLYIGDFKAAETQLLRSIETYREIDSYEVDAPLNNLGLVYMQEGRLTDTRAVLEEAEDRASEDFSRICAVSNIAAVERLEGKPLEALRRLGSVVELVRSSGEPLIQDYFAFNMATNLLKSGKPKEALDWLERFPLNSWKGDSGLAEAKRLRMKGAILQAMGRLDESKACIGRAGEVLNTKRPQKWFYELDYYPCDIHILD